MKKRSERKGKYAEELGQLEADGVQMKNKRRLVHFLEKANGDVNAAKQLIAKRQEKHRQRKGPDLTTTTTTNSREPHGLSTDDLQNLKRLRTAGLHGNPKRMLATFHECNESIEMTIARTEEAREKRCRERWERTAVRMKHLLFFTMTLNFSLTETQWVGHGARCLHATGRGTCVARRYRTGVLGW